MRLRSRIKHIQTYFAASLAVLSLTAMPFFVDTAAAATANSIYSYTFNGNSTIANAAAANSGATLNLYEVGNGATYDATYGEHFTGNKNSTGYVASGAGYKPSSGNTFSVSTSQAIGVGARFKYEGPTSGCNTDSQNITQIGRANQGGQVKLQLSKCSDYSDRVYVQCRMEGTSSSALVDNTQPLINGYEYIVRCTKEADSAGHEINLRVTKIDSTNGNIVTGLLFTGADAPATGSMSSTAYLSVANKLNNSTGYGGTPLPQPADNTDQFKGYVKKVSYCQAGSLVTARQCLVDELPEPGNQQFVLNPGVENTGLLPTIGGMTGWAGEYGNGSATIARSSSYAHSGSYGILVTATSGANNTAHGFYDSPSWTAGATYAGQTYTGKVWVKPMAVGQVIHLRLQEFDSSGALVTDRNGAITAASTSWQQLTRTLTAAGTDNTLRMTVYAAGMYPGDYFAADDMSLTMPSYP